MYTYTLLPDKAETIQPLAMSNNQPAKIQMLFATTNFTHKAKFWNMGTWIPLTINDQVMIKKADTPT